MSEGEKTTNSYLPCIMAALFYEQFSLYRRHSNYTEGIDYSHDCANIAVYDYPSRGRWGYLTKSTLVQNVDLLMHL